MSDKLFLHAPNEFIPTDFELVPREEKKPVKVPKIILDDDTTRLWYLQDNE